MDANSIIKQVKGNVTLGCERIWITKDQLEVLEQTLGDLVEANKILISIKERHEDTIATLCQEVPVRKVAQTFREHSMANHDGNEPNEQYLRDQQMVIGDYFIRGIAALDARASDECCVYCQSIAVLL